MFDRRTMLASGAALVAAPALAKGKMLPKPVNPAFPKDFLWGTATAGHQVEGNNVNADCWLLEQVKPSVFADPSGDAANSFALWGTDMDLVKNLGLNSYRFSLEWARIEPEPGQFSRAMLDHYKAMIAGARERGIEPIVTFNHFTTPRWFAAMGGWMHPDSPGLFARYCDRAARHLADGIGHATTLNEPNLAGILQELIPGDFIAGDKDMAAAAAKAIGSNTFVAGNALYVPDADIFSAHLIAGHKAGKAAIKAVRSDLPVGVSLAMVDDQAVGKNSLRDAKREHFYGPWLRAVKGDDFLGVQNYARSVWSDKGQLPAPSGARLNSLGAEVYAPSLAGAVRYAHEETGCPIMVTEHGVGTNDDTIRAWLIPAALAELKKVMDEGVPVKGYLHWSLIDNFEWIFGYKIQFGLHRLDRVSFARTAKPSAAVYGAIAARNSL